MLGVSCRDRVFLRVGFPSRDIAFYVAIIGHGVLSQPSRGHSDNALGVRTTDLDNAIEGFCHDLVR